MCEVALNSQAWAHVSLYIDMCTLLLVLSYGVVTMYMNIRALQCYLGEGRAYEVVGGVYRMLLFAPVTTHKKGMRKFVINLAC